MAIGRRGTGSRINPLRVEFQRPKEKPKLYEEHFGCPVTFGAKHNKLFFRKEDLQQPFVTHNQDLFELVAPQLEAELTQQLADKSLKERVKGTLKKLIAGQRPRLEDVARELRVSSRTLQRNLLAEQVTFLELMEEARRELARHYLVQPSLQLNETAYLLGYEDLTRLFGRFISGREHLPASGGRPGADRRRKFLFVSTVNQRRTSRL